MVSKPRSRHPKGMRAKFTIKVKKFEYGSKVFQHLLQKFEDEKILAMERGKILWFLEDRHERKVSRKRGEEQAVRIVPPHKTPPRIKILL